MSEINASENNRTADLVQEVMAKIHEGGARMRPRTYFVVGAVLLGVGLAGAVVAALFFLSVVFFHLRSIGPLGYLWFGQLGWRAFLETVPWLAIFLAILGLTVGIFLLRGFEFSYHWNFLAVAVAFVGLATTLSFLLDLVGVNERLAHVPMVQPFYQRPFAGQNWLAGQVQETGERRLILLTPQGRTVIVTWHPKTSLPSGSAFRADDRLRLVGEWHGDEFVAQGIGLGGLRWRFIPLPQVRGRQIQDLTN